MTNDIRQRIGAELRALREAKGLTTRELAELVGLDHSHIAKIERGVYNLRVDTLDKVATAFGITMHLVSWIPLEKFIGDLHQVYRDLNCSDIECLEEAIATVKKEGPKIYLGDLLPGENYLIDGVLSYYGYIY